MITLQNKLYESLLDDEEDLVNNDDVLIEQWADYLGIEKVNNKNLLTYNNTNCYYNDKGKIYTSNINPNIILKWATTGVTRNYTLNIEDILPEYLDFKYIAGLSLGINLTNCSCPDILTSKGLKKLSNYPIEKLLISYGNTNLEFINFDLIGQNKLKNLTIRMPRLSDESFVDIKYWPKFKLDTLWIESRQRPVILDNIKGLNCKNFIFEGARFDEKTFKMLTIDDPFKISSTLDNSDEGIAILDRFFQNNNVDYLIYLRRFNLKTYKYQIEKKGRGKGYKLTRLR